MTRCIFIFVGFVGLLVSLVGCASSDTAVETASPDAQQSEAAPQSTAPAEPAATAPPESAQAVSEEPANPPQPSPVLEEVSDADLSEKKESVPVNPAFSKLKTKLNELGYEPIGLEYESTANLTLLYKVFSSAQLKNRRIQRVYTGMDLEYDAKAQALTVGGTQSVAKILAFIRKRVPRR